MLPPLWPKVRHTSALQTGRQAVVGVSGAQGGGRSVGVTGGRRRSWGQSSPNCDLASTEVLRRTSRVSTTVLPAPSRSSFDHQPSTIDHLSSRAQKQRVGTLRSRTAGAPIRVRGKAPQLSREGAAASRPSAQPPTTTQRSWRLSALRDCLWVVTDAGVDVVGGVGRSSRLN